MTIRENAEEGLNVDQQLRMFPERERTAKAAEEIAPPVSLKLMRGDCLERMKEIPGGSVDMVLCDLPYGVTQNPWDTVIPFEPLWEQYHHACKPNAAIVLFGQMPFGAKLILSNPREFRYEWVYEKTNPSGFLNAHKMPMKSHENIMVFYRRLPRFNPIMREGFKAYTKKAGINGCSSNYGRFQKQLLYSSPDGKRFPVDVIRFSNQSWGKDTGLHPTQKPVALLEYLIKTYTAQGETVLDNCMGSGSTGVACVRTGRNFIGIERDAGYFEIARRRLEKEQRGAGEPAEPGGDPFNLDALMEMGEGD